MRQKGPQTVSSVGGRLALEDNGETPDVQEAVYSYPGFTMAWSHREASSSGSARGGGGLEFHGTKGHLTIGRGGFQITSDMKADPSNMIPTFQGHPGGGPTRTQTKPEPWIQQMEEKGSSPEQFDLHARNFLDAIKTRQRTVADVEDGHWTSVACHLANISLRLGRSLRWDPEKETIAGDREANQMLTRPYRKPWDGVLRSLLS
jgi:predicted dehydrogenase